MTEEERLKILRQEWETFYHRKMEEATPEEVNRVRAFFEEQAKKRGQAKQEGKTMAYSEEEMRKKIRQYEGIPLDAPVKPLSEKQEKQLELFLRELEKQQKLQSK